MVVRQTSVLCPSTRSADNWHLRYHTGYGFFRLTCVPQNCTQSKIITVWSMQLFIESRRNGPSMLVDLIVMSRDYSYKYFRHFLFREFIHHRFISTWHLTLIFLFTAKENSNFTGARRNIFQRLWSIVEPNAFQQLRYSCTAHRSFYDKTKF